MSLIAQINEMKLLIQQAESEVSSLQNGKKASSARVRKSLQDIKTKAHSLRKAITETTQALPVKARVKKVVEAPVEAVPEPEPEPEPVVEPVKKKRVSKTKFKFSIIYLSYLFMTVRHPTRH